MFAIRHAFPKDLPSLLPLYQRARAFMAANGNPNQWGDRYPTEEILSKDIQNHRLYLCENDGETAAAFMFFIGEEPNYAVIEDGDWPDRRPYGTIHRIASCGRFPGAGSFCVSWCYEQCRRAGAGLRGDTHEKNLPMQRVFKKNGFSRCGRIRVEDGTERIAFQKSFRPDENSHPFARYR